MSPAGFPLFTHTYTPPGCLPHTASEPETPAETIEGKAPTRPGASGDGNLVDEYTRAAQLVA
ncbi:MAG TPA: hypothetical protein VK357_02925 [Rubrobacteraceae bacterium]|nr:hypothetical protein [Rubrobacteraceae bacterium]